MILTAAIFNKCHGLDPPTEKEQYDTAKLLNDDVEGTREERAFRNWMNCLGIDDLYVNNLYEDVKDGCILLKVLDKIHPGCVDWKKVDKNPSNKFKKMVNCNEAVDAAKKCGFSIVGVAGTDIHEGNKKLILGIVWQMMKHHTLKVLGGKTEDDLVKWANDMVITTKITGFRDKILKNSLFFIDLMNSIESRAINWDLVIKDKEDDESLENNAKYCISIARRLGASIFIVWEDIKEVKPKMIMTFVAGLYDVYLLSTQLKDAKDKVRQEQLKQPEI
jgi:plastin-1